MTVAGLGAWQRELARAVNDDDDGDPALRHARAILHRKRAERRPTKTTTTRALPFSLWSQL